MENNLYMATEGFGDDDIFNILMRIRTYLDYENCSMTSEYYVIREADCPSGSNKLTTSIYNTTGVNHCYIIQNLTHSFIKKQKINMKWPNMIIKLYLTKCSV